MNCKKTREKIWLAESQELDGAASAELEAHLAACAACREDRDQIREILARVDQALPAGEPSAWVMTRIRAAAAARAGTGRWVWRGPAVRVLAAAALLVVAAGVWWMTWSGARAERIRRVGTLLVMVSTEDRTDIAGTAGAGAETELRDVARELLILEGLADENGSDPFSPAWDILSTDPLSRSSVAPDARRCV